MGGYMDTGMDLPIKIRTREKLTVYTAWEVSIDTDSKLIEVNGAIRHVPNYENEDVVPKGLMRKMRETQLMLIGYMQPKDYVVDAIVVPENSIIIIEDMRKIKCGIASENHAIVNANYVIENVAEVECPTYEELIETMQRLETLDYRLNSLTYKYDLMVLAILKKNNLVQLT